MDSFRWGANYYKVTGEVDAATLSTADIKALGLRVELVLMKTVAHSLKLLHDLRIVHSDLKPSNVLIKRTELGYTTKLIDFDSSYIAGRPPPREDIVVACEPRRRPPSRATWAASSGSSCGNSPTELCHEHGLALPNARRCQPGPADMHGLRCHRAARPATPGSRKVATPQRRRAGASTSAADSASTRAPGIANPG